MPHPVEDLSARPLRSGVPARLARGPLRWQLLTTGVDEAWAAVARAAHGATYFHTPAWARLMSAVFSDWRPDPVVLEFSDDNVALVPWMVRRGRLGGGYRESSLPGVYGGPLFLRPPTQGHWHAVWQHVDEQEDVFLYGNPFQPFDGEPSGSLQIETTEAIDLTAGIDAVRGRFRPNHRRGIRKASSEHGFEVGLARSRADVAAYDLAYRQSLRRWGWRRAHGFHPRHLFERLYDLAERDDGVRFWVLRRAGEVVGGAWILTHQGAAGGGHVDYWHACVRDDARRGFGMHLLVAEALAEACAVGASWFDFNPSGGLTGVDFFKHGFGARTLEFPVVTRFRGPARAYRRLLRLGEKYLGRCPL